MPTAAGSGARSALQLAAARVVEHDLAHRRATLALAARGAAPARRRQARRSRRRARRLATASAATPSPRPTKPIPSPVVAFTLTRSGARPERARQALADRARGGARASGASMITVQSTLTDPQALGVEQLAHRRAAARSSPRRASARRCRGSARRCRRGPAAPSSASITRVREHVGVGVPLEAALVRDLDAAEHQPPPGRRGGGSHSRCRPAAHARSRAPPAGRRLPRRRSAPCGARRPSNTHSSPHARARRAARAPARSRRRRPAGGARRSRARPARRLRGTSRRNAGAGYISPTGLRRPAVESSTATPASAIASTAGS